jgi:hypothetical protein
MWESAAAEVTPMLIGLRGDRSEKLSFVYARALYSPTPRLQLLHSPKPVPL